ncbi:lipopolysaccharide biosynthesis protein [Amycolatopsis nigrescens]|uniref:lipopolysaccharide biosynthesis protein n=1 Tax=Amycolatopsis nigrescens TaxID=381445 RepID=UPI00035E1C45|nr:lipopolysaccharide biosynthesis protein [Amycolatopsis nigrescens]
MTTTGRHRRAESPIRRALSFSALNTVLSKVGTFATGIVLARLLSPADFGVYAVAFVALIALLSLNELGVSLAVVRWPGDPARILPTVTTISMISSGLLYAACYFGAPAFTKALGAADATGVVRLLCVAVLVDGLTAPIAQLVNREFRQGIRLLVDLANLLVTTGVTVSLAATGHGAWSLAGGQLAGNVTASIVLFTLVRRWPRPGFDPACARELLRFGLPLAGSSLLLVAMLNIDYVITGRMLGAVALGFYLQAFNLASWPVNMFSLVVRRVSLAAFARVQEDEAERESVLARMATLLAVPTLPVCALLGLLALPVVTTLYGTKWSESASVLQFLVILGVVRVAGELGYDFLVALGRSRTTLWLQGGWLVSLGIALPVGALLGGIQGVAIAHAAVAVLLVLPAFVFAVCRTGVRARVLAAAVKLPVLGCLLMAAVVFGVRMLTPAGFGQLVLGGTLGLATYAVVVWPLRHSLKRS